MINILNQSLNEASLIVQASSQIDIGEMDIHDYIAYVDAILKFSESIKPFVVKYVLMKEVESAEEQED